ncbi:hypothetical protein A2U01_0104527, partial [Trifolium medium]|nr:hypothetical protein [Trifolium medium]
KKVARELLFDPEIEKTAKANRKAARLAEASTRNTSGESSQSKESIMAEDPPPPPRRTLGDYGQRGNGAIANLG